MFVVFTDDLQKLFVVLNSYTSDSKNNVLCGCVYSEEKMQWTWYRHGKPSWNQFIAHKSNFKILSSSQRVS